MGKSTNIHIGSSPQSSLYADKPGSYKLIVESTKSHINPGDTVVLRVFISGYGLIRQPKLRVQPPSSAIVEKESKVSYDFNEGMSGKYEWGVTTRDVLKDGITIALAGGPSPSDWDEPSFIIDVDPDHKDNNNTNRTIYFRKSSD